MISNYEKFRIKDELQQRDLIAEVNWDEKDKKSNECKLIRLTYPDGATAIVKRELLNEFLFAIGKEDDQQRMIPQKIVEMKWYETVLSVKANHDIRKGENITFPVKISIPSQERQIIGKLKDGIKELKDRVKINAPSK